MRVHRPWAGYVLALLGVIGVLLELAFHLWTAYRHYMGIPGDVYELNHWVLIALTILGFVGWYLIKPKSAEDGADIITRNAVRLIIAVRSGRRDTDTFTAVLPADVKPGDVAVIAKPNPPPHPDGSAAPSIAGGDERVEDHG